MRRDAAVTQPGHAISGEYYSAEDIWSLVDQRPRLRLDGEVAASVAAGAAVVAAKARSDEHVYGINTGLGALCETRVAADQLRELQRRIVLSHACPVGQHASEEVCRTALLLKLLTFRFGVSGVRPELVARLLDHWNEGLIPSTPLQGSLGASGDLAPLARMALPLLGHGELSVDGRLEPAAAALGRLGWSPVELAPKEGLALINGVQFSTAIGLVCLRQATELLAAGSMIAAISCQAFSTANTFYDARYHRLSAHGGQRHVAGELARLLEGSNHFSLPSCNVSHQDPYSFRCIPQVHGACRDAVAFARAQMEAEANSPGDNPLVIDDEDGAVLYGGNLHGEPVAFALDVLAIAMTELASISERRSFQLLAGTRGLPEFLVGNPGLNTGYMIAQYTAASLVAECSVLASPASVHNAMTSKFQEDHVSMSGNAATKLQSIVENCVNVLAVELALAVQASEFTDGLVLSGPTGDVARAFREWVPPLVEDRIIEEDLRQSARFIVERMGDWRRRQPA